MQREIKFTEDEIALYYRRRMPQLAQRGDQWRGPCPVHRGERNNFAVDPNTGRWFCHSKCGRGGDIFELEKDLEDLTFLEAKTSVLRIVGRGATTFRSIERTDYSTQDSMASRGYIYRAADGSPAYRKIRQWEGVKKTFYFQRRTSDGTWSNGLGKSPRLLYQLPELRLAGRVFYVEGEKDVHTLTDAGLIATTAGGSDDWRVEFAEEFRGKEVVVLFDNDEPGRRHARKVSEAIHGIAHSVKVVELPGLLVAGDVSDWLDMGHTVAELQDLVKACPTFDPTSQFPLLENPRADGGRIRSVLDLPPISAFDSKLEWLVEDLIPLDSMNLLSGPSGSGKSYVALGLAGAVANGTSFIGRKTVPVRPTHGGSGAVNRGLLKRWPVSSSPAATALAH